MNKMGKQKPLPKKVTKSKEDKEDNEEESAALQELRFERELAWCVQELETGLANEDTKQPSRQTQEALTLLKVLKSDSAPLVKKRQAMRSAFGDYRAKMADERRFRAGDEKVQLASGPTSQPQKFTFLRKSAHTTSSSAQPSCAVPENGNQPAQNTVTSESDTGNQTNLQTSSMVFGDQPTGFRFNFSGPKTVPSDSGTAFEERLQTMSLAESTPEAIATNTSGNTQITRDSATLQPSDNSFKFNFLMHET